MFFTFLNPAAMRSAHANSDLTPLLQPTTMLSSLSKPAATCAMNLGFFSLPCEVKKR
uniref:Uncharacterized protein n=1 Tax=Zea mays TaxID=4577 RepID=C0PKJ9_MAIZE|nr:unknown [Zea mays]